MQYKHSLNRLYALLVIDFVLIFAMGLGIVLMLYHLIEYFKEYLTINDKSVILNKGLIITHEIEVPFNKINSVSVRKGILGGILGYGNIVIFTGNDSSGIVFSAVDNPQEIKTRLPKGCTRSSSIEYLYSANRTCYI